MPLRLDGCAAWLCVAAAPLGITVYNRVQRTTSASTVRPPCVHRACVGCSTVRRASMGRVGVLKHARHANVSMCFSPKFVYKLSPRQPFFPIYSLCGTFPQCAFAAPSPVGGDSIFSIRPPCPSPLDAAAPGGVGRARAAIPTLSPWCRPPRRPQASARARPRTRSSPTCGCSAASHAPAPVAAAHETTRRRPPPHPGPSRARMAEGRAAEERAAPARPCDWWVCHASRRRPFTETEKCKFCCNRLCVPPSSK